MHDFIKNNFVGRPNTLRTYDSLFRKRLLPAIKNEKTLPELVNYWKRKGLSYRTIKSLIFLYGKYMGTQGQVVDTKPILRSIKNLQQESEAKALSREELKILLNNLDGDIYYATAISAFTGLRRGEVFGLTWREINFTNNTIIVKRSYDGPTKNGKSRIIPLHPTLKKMLKKRKRDNSKESSRVIRVIDVDYHLKKVSMECLGKKVNFHMLRHTFATLALEAKKSPKMVQQTLGHSKLSTTLDLYWQQTQEYLDLDFLD